MIEEIEELEEIGKLILESESKPYISFEESAMVGEGEEEVNNLNGEQPRIGEGRGGGRDGGRGRGENTNLEPF